MRIIQAWGMTETSPLGLRRAPAGRRRGRGALGLPRRRPGRIMPLVEARLIDDDGEEVPWDGESTGELEVRGPWIAARLLRGPGRRARSSTTAGCAPATSPSIDAARLHPDLRPHQGRDQVRRRVDLLGRARERADGAPDGRRGGGDRHARRALGRAPAGLRRARARAQSVDRRGAARAPRARASRSGGCPTSSRSSTRCRRPASASSTRRSCASALEEGELETVSESEPASRSA